MSSKVNSIPFRISADLGQVGGLDSSMASFHRPGDDIGQETGIRSEIARQLIIIFVHRPSMLIASPTTG
jgi:hypothetical protein